MTVRESILKSTIGRALTVGGVASAILAGGVVFAPTAANAAENAQTSAMGVYAGESAARACLAAAPKPEARTQAGNCGLSRWNHGYKSNRVVGKKRCYYFLTTAWNPCSIPAQYNSSACKAI
jgi:hypothetical protein